MKNLKIILCSFMFLSLVSISYSQTVDEIIQKHTDALGGYDNLIGLKSMKSTGNMEVMGMTFPFTNYSLKPNKTYNEINFQGMTIIEACDGTIGWTINPMAGKTKPEIMDEISSAEFKKQARILNPLIDYKNEGAKVELAGIEKVKDKDSYKIIYSGSDGDVVNYYIDVNNFFINKIEKEVLVLDKKVESAMYPSDYKKAGNIMWAYTNVITLQGDTPMEETMSIKTIEFNIDIDESIFSMPK